MRDPNLDDAAAHKATTHHFLGTLWLLNSAAPETLTSNLVQAYISGDDRYPANIERAFAMVEAEYRAPLVIHAAPTPPWHNHLRLPTTEDVVVELDAVLAMEAGAVQPQTVGTGAGIVAVDNVSSRTVLMMLTVVQKKKLLR